MFVDLYVLWGFRVWCVFLRQKQWPAIGSENLSLERGIRNVAMFRTGRSQRYVA